MSVRIKGSTYLVETDTDGNLFVRLPANKESAGYARLLDSNGKDILTTENGALSVSQDSILFRDQVEGAALDSRLWQASVSGLTVTQASGYINVNGGAASTANAYAILQSIKYFPMYSYLPLRVTFQAATPNIAQTNATMELGIGLTATNAAPTDGCLFRWNSSAEFRCVVNNAGVETMSAAIPAPPQNDATLFEIVIVEDVVQFFVDDEMVAEVEVPAGQAFPTNNGRLPIFARCYNGGSAPAAPPILWVGQVIVVQEGAVQNRPWAHALAQVGSGAYQSPVTPFGQTANHANSTSPSSATLSNTAAGYTTLGGRFQFAAPASAVTDFALFGFQVPAGYQLVVDAIAISLVNTGAIGSAVTPTILDWALGLNASAVSLATVDGAGTWAPRRIPLGLQTFGLSAAIGAQATDIVRRFETPLVVDGGRFLHLILQVPLGAATGSQVLRGDFIVSGFFE